VALVIGRLEIHPPAIATAFAEARADLLDAATQLAQEHGSMFTSFLRSASASATPEPPGLWKSWKKKASEENLQNKVTAAEQPPIQGYRNHL